MVCTQEGESSKFPGNPVFFRLYQAIDPDSFFLTCLQYLLKILIQSWGMMSAQYHVHESNGCSIVYQKVLSTLLELCLRLSSFD